MLFPFEMIAKKSICSIKIHFDIEEKTKNEKEKKVPLMKSVM